MVFYLPFLAPYVGLSTFFVSPFYIPSNHGFQQLDYPGEQPDLRTAQTAQRMIISDGATGEPLFWLVNVHLPSHIFAEGPAIRLNEMSVILNWMEDVLVKTNGR